MKGSMRLAYNGRGIYSFISIIIEISAKIRIFFHYDGQNPQKTVSFVNEYGNSRAAEESVLQ